MSDEKLRQSLGDLPTESDGIPVPITNGRIPPSSSFRRAVLASVVLVVGYVYFSGISFRPYSLPNLSDFASHHGHRHGHKFLRGKAAEKAFLEVPNEKSCIKTSYKYTKQPHPAGSDGDLETAKDFLAHLQNELGIEPPAETPIFPAGSPESQSAILSIPKAHKLRAWIDIYYPVMNTPLDRNLQALDDNDNVIWEADLTEHADNTDPTAGKYANAVPTFHGLSRGGDVSGRLIYVNYGLKEEYEALVEKGVNFTGAIVLARYGGNFRGLKVKAAQELGAAGVLIYSDYRDDGVVTAENGYEVYPNGPARNPTAVQRGSVQFLSLYPGDPTTPSVPAYENSTRTEGENIPKIPSLPISAANAGKLMELLKGGEWNGVVRLNNQVDTKVMPIWNTMAVIPGFIKDEVVVVGNHRDAWVLGGADPNSGTASISETIRGFGVLLKKGWRPLRTIVIASWDAEEYGLIGSTEWGEDFAKFIDKYVVAYLNVDSSVSGSRFAAEASPLLAHLVQQTALDIPHPTKEGLTLWDATQDSGKFFGNRTGGVSTMDSEALEVYNAKFANLDELGVGVLGSGSDYTVFLQRLGVASMNHGFGRTMNDPVYHYHSIYDSQRWQELYADPGFFRHVAVAKYLGLITLRLVDPIVLPLNTTHYSFELEKYLDKVEGLVSAQSLSLDLSPLRDSIHSLQAASLALDYEKLVAERELVDILKSLQKKVSKWRKWKKKMRKVYCKWQKKVFGRECKKHHHDKHEWTEDLMRFEEWSVEGHLPHLPSGGKPRVGRLPAWIQEQKEYDHREIEILRGLTLHAGVKSAFNSRGGCTRGTSDASHHPRLPLGKLRAVVKRVRTVNKKLVAFERGLISEDGIPEREWYKHLGVAPGKWLGYGATTLPALTESITFEKNATLAKHEMNRLKDLVDGIVEKLRV